MAERKVRAFDGLAEELAQREGKTKTGDGAAPKPKRRAWSGHVQAYAEARDGELLEIPVSSIRPNPANFFHVDDIEELAADIAQVGLLHPLVVRHAPDGATDYEIISGERRWRALTLLSEREGGRERDAKSIVRIMSDDDAAHALISANVETRELTVRERIEAISRMREIVERRREAGTVSGNTAELVAEAIGMAPRQVKRYQALAAAVPELVEAVDADLLTLRSAVELAARAPEVQTAALAELRGSYDGRKHTEAEAAAIVARVAKPTPKKRPVPAGPVERVEKSLRSSLMTLKRVVAIEDAKRHEIAALAREIITLVEEGTEG
ncbi:MAG: ParB/RepB/Spo0J family partition protein [Leucobacter sp.]